MHALDQKGRLLLRGRRVPQERADNLRRPAVLDAPRHDYQLAAVDDEDSVRVRVPPAPTTAAADDTPAAVGWWVSGSHADADPGLAAAAHDAAQGDAQLGAARVLEAAVYHGSAVSVLLLPRRQEGDGVRGEGAGGLRLRGRDVSQRGEDGVCQGARLYQHIKARSLSPVLMLLWDGKYEVEQNSDLGHAL